MYAVTPVFDLLKFLFSLLEGKQIPNFTNCTCLEWKHFLKLFIDKLELDQLACKWSLLIVSPFLTWVILLSCPQRFPM